MSEDSSPVEQDDEEAAPVDVKAKMAAMSGNRLKKERGKRRAAAAKRSNKAIANSRTEPEPSVFVPPPVEKTDADTQAPSPAATPAAPTPRKKPPKKDAADESISIGPITTFVAGFLGGFAPALILIAVGIATNVRPAGLPADAVQRSRDWIQCPEAVGDARWRCDVYNGSGEVTGSGEFVPSTDGRKITGTWSQRSDALVQDGWFVNKMTNTKTLYVRGVSVTTQRGAK